MFIPDISLLTFVAFDLLLHELLLLVEISFSGLFGAFFREIYLKINIWICLRVIQVKFNFSFYLLQWSYSPLQKFSFLDFLSRLFLYRLEIWYILYRRNTDQVQISKRLT